ncbi:MAG: ribonuclease M5 [Thermobacillus sp. ZCTH02-B1]|uniref:ribonuclease M5 n=1 Tax=Thermobacillus sp. ZCTH02-B1 TaxID=1858795 RepID=UPI000B578640|nr:ribonuclease M5 [Thermobacillus sp. ZCTH02-B1]OUM95560.1 MAG: ribonuclease M5 [Thermobacillus sp. ZCTH02-B1]
MIREVIVVEGKDDTAAVKRAVEADTIETGGSAIGEEVLRRIELAAARRGVIIFTDPDREGERIRRIVAERVPGCKHAFLPRELAERDGKYGVEHATPEAIRQALAAVRTERPAGDAGTDVVEWSDMMAAGLIVHPRAAERRREVGRLLGIGYANGKQFYRRLRMLCITKRELGEALAAMDGEEGGSG